MSRGSHSGQSVQFAFVCLHISFYLWLCNICFCAFDTNLNLDFFSLTHLNLDHNQLEMSENLNVDNLRFSLSQLSLASNGLSRVPEIFKETFSRHVSFLQRRPECLTGFSGFSGLAKLTKHLPLLWYVSSLIACGASAKWKRLVSSMSQTFYSKKILSYTLHVSFLQRRLLSIILLLSTQVWNTSWDLRWTSLYEHIVCTM